MRDLKKAAYDFWDLNKCCECELWYEELEQFLEEIVDEVDEERYER